MKQSLKVWVVLAILLVAGLTYFLLADRAPSDNTNGGNDDDEVIVYKDLIRVEEPLENELVSSPLIVKGEARGQWYFEASFPVTLTDAGGNVIKASFATAQGEWMTTNYVPFEAEIDFAVPAGVTSGFIVLEKSNPSGLSEHADELKIPVRFSGGGSAQRTVSLYYYNEDLDKDEDGNIMCSQEGIVAVERIIPVTQTPIQDTIRLLIKGELTPAERAQGISTEYPLDGFALNGASLADGDLTLAFEDPNSETTGGSCRVGILWLQIKETAEQFAEVDEAQFQPETLFQP